MDVDELFIDLLVSLKVQLFWDDKLLLSRGPELHELLGRATSVSEDVADSSKIQDRERNSDSKKDRLDGPCSESREKQWPKQLSQSDQTKSRCLNSQVEKTLSQKQQALSISSAQPIWAIFEAKQDLLYQFEAKWADDQELDKETLSWCRSKWGARNLGRFK